MCHEYYDHARPWLRVSQQVDEEGTDEFDEDLPSFATEESPDDVEILTDGGDSA